MTKYVLQEMGQSIVTSHSPYVIEQFDPKSVVILARDGDQVSGSPIDAASVKPKTYRAQRRQFAEAILSRAVLVVEGQTEMVAVHATSSALDRLRPGYAHIDLAGVSLFNAGNDREVPKFAPIFKTMGKRVYGMRDKLNAPDATNAAEDIKSFDQLWESPELGIEQLLVKQVPLAVLRTFLDEAVQRDDYPAASHPYVSEQIPDAALTSLAVSVLKARKGDNYGLGYAAMLIDQCRTEADLPAFIRDALIAIDQDLGNVPELVLVDEATVPPDVEE